MNISLSPRLKSVLANSGLALGSLVFAFLLCEIASRLYLYGGLTPAGSHLPPLVREPDPDTGWRLAPNQEAIRTTLDYSLIIRTNAQGLRDPERPVEPESGDFTIVVLGDSYMEAAHVEEEQGFTRMLEASLGGGFRVINLGVGGYSTVQEWRAFETQGKTYKPDLVLLAFYAENDVYGNSAELSLRMWGADEARTYSSPFAALDANGALVVTPPDYERARAEYEKAIKRYNPTLQWLGALKESAVEKIYKQAISGLRQRVHNPGEDVAIHLGAYADFAAGDPAVKALWDDAYKITGAVLYRMRDDVAAAGAKLAVFAVPSKLQTQPAYQEAVKQRYPEMHLDLEAPHRRLEALCRDGGIPCHDLMPEFRAAAEGGADLNYTMEDSHWNPAGHALAASKIAAWLQESGLLEKDPPETPAAP